MKKLLALALLTLLVGCSDDEPAGVDCDSISVEYSPESVNITVGGLSAGASYDLFRSPNPLCDKDNQDTCSANYTFSSDSSTYTIDEGIPTAQNSPERGNIYYSLHSPKNTCKLVWYSNVFPEASLFYNAFSLDGNVVVMNGFSGSDITGNFGLSNDISLSDTAGINWKGVGEFYDATINFKLYGNGLAVSEFDTVSSTPTNFNYGIYVIAGKKNATTLTNEIWKNTSTDVGHVANFTQLTTDPARIFSPRYGVASAFYQEKIYTYGGITNENPYTYSSEIWRSNGTTSTSETILWTNIVPDAPFGKRAYSQLLSIEDPNNTNLNGLYLIGGTDGTTIFNDIWHSTDGTTWVQLANDIFPSRIYFQAIYVDGSIYISGGVNLTDATNITKDQIYGDIWKTSDGISWSKIASDTPMGKRFGHSLVAVHKEGYAPKLLSIGGVNENLIALADVHSIDNTEISSNNWKKVFEKNGSLPFYKRFNHKLVKFKDKFFIIGGAQNFKILNTTQNSSNFLLNDIWTSDDGKIWKKSVANASFSPREGHLIIEFDDQLYLIGGRAVNTATSTDEFLNDIWSSTDGLNWTLVSANIPLGDEQDTRPTVECDPIFPTTKCIKFGAREGLSAIVITQEQATETIPAGVYILDKYYIWYSTDMLEWLPYTIKDCNLNQIYAHLNFFQGILQYFGGFTNDKTRPNNKFCSTNNLINFNPSINMPTSNSYALSNFIKNNLDDNHYLIAGLDETSGSTGKHKVLNTISLVEFAPTSITSIEATATQLVFENRFGQAAAISSDDNVVMTGGTSNLCYLDNRKCLSLIGVPPPTSTFDIDETMEVSPKKVWKKDYSLGISISSGSLSDPTTQFIYIIKPIPYN